VGGTDLVGVGGMDVGVEVGSTWVGVGSSGVDGAGFVGVGGSCVALGAACATVGGGSVG